MSYLIKGLAGVAGCSGLCGGYFVIKHLNGKEDIRPTARTLITESGRTLLDASSNQWVDRWSEYVTATGNPLGIKDYDQLSKNKQQVPDSFKNTCLTRVNEKVSGEDDQLFKDLSTYCIEMIDLTKLITDQGLRDVLSDSGDDEGGRASWESYDVNNPEGNKGRISTGDTAKNNLQNVPQELKTNCTSKKAEKAYGIKDIKFKNVIDGCTKAKG